MVTTAQLKQELTEKVDRALKRGIPIHKSASILQKKYPPGVKVHMYKEVVEDSKSAKR